MVDQYIKAICEKSSVFRRFRLGSLFHCQKDRGSTLQMELKKKKTGIPGVETPRYNVNIVDKCFTLRGGINYNQTFSPIVKYNYNMDLLAMITLHDLK